jgi:hypothetical protein
MSFGPVSFAPSPAVTSTAEGFSAALEGLQQSFAEGAASLGELSLPASGASGLLEQMRQARAAAAETVTAPVRFMAITPFQYGVGVRKGEYSFLSPEQALGTLAERISETGSSAVDDADGDEDIELALVVLIIATQTHALMGQALEAFNKVYPVAQLEQACRRAKALATLETDKFVIPKSPGFPPWAEASPQKDAKGQAVARALGGLVALGEGAAMGAAAPGAILADFGKKQAAKIAQKTTDLAALGESMSGTFDTWAGLCIHGPGPALFRYLAKLQAPFDASCKCTSLLCWFGKPAEVAYYRESFGLRPLTLVQTETIDDKIILCLPEIAEAEAGRAGNSNDAKGWRYLREFFLKWLQRPARRYPNIDPKPFWIDWDWVMSFPRADAAYGMLTFHEDYVTPGGHPNNIYNAAARDRIASYLRRDGKLANKREEFDHTAGTWRNWLERSFQYRGVPRGTSVDGLLAALGEFTFRCLARGHVEPNDSGGHTITVTGVSVFVEDRFTFQEGEPFLFWSCEEKMFSLAAIRPSFTFLTGTDFLRFQDRHNCGSDFIVLSLPHAVANFQEMRYNTP